MTPGLPAGVERPSLRITLALASIYGATPSGGDLQMLEIVREWADDGACVTVLTNSHGARQLESSCGRHLPLEVVGGAGRKSLLATYLASCLGVTGAAWRSMRSPPGPIRPIFISGSFYPPDILAGLIARLRGADWVISWAMDIPPPWHPYAGPSAGRGPVQTSLGGLALRLRQTLRQSASFISQEVAIAAGRLMGARFAVTGPLMVDSAARHRLRADKVFVTSLGARASRDAAVLVEPGDRPYDAVFLGRFHPQKGIEDLIEIWRTVLRSRPQGRLAVAGDGSGSYSSAVKSALATLPPGSIELVGTVLGSEKETLLANGRILVFPSHYESAGQVVLEAMALGLPVVGYDIPSSRDLYEDAMLLVPPFDRECFARTTVDLLCDDHLYQLASRRSLALAAHHDWKIIARDLASSLRLS